MRRFSADGSIRGSFRWGAAFDLVLIVGIVAAVYWPVLTHRYAFTDDFWVFFSGEDLSQTYLSAGRPILAITWIGIHERIDHVAQLAPLRFVSMLGVCAIACHMYLLACRITRLRVARVGMALSIAALPSLTVLVAWATCWMYAFAALLALWAGLVAESAVRTASAGPARPILRFLCSCAMLVIALGIYQPAAGWFWMVPLVNILDRRFLRSGAYRARVFALGAVGMLQFVICFLALKLYFVVTGIAPQQRSELLHEPFAKLYELFRLQIPLVLNQWQVLDASRKPTMIAIGLFVALVLLGGGLAFIRRNTLTRGTAQFRWGIVAVWLICILTALAMTHAHWWAVNVNARNYRTAGAFAASVTVALWWSVLQLTGPRRRAPRRRRLATCVSILLALIALAKCSSNLDRFWIYPYSTAYAFTVGELSARVSPATHHIHVIRQKAGEGIVTGMNIYNFGRPFSDVEWAIEGLVRVALADAGVDANIQEITHGTGDEPVPSGPDVCVIDMRELVRFRR